MTHGTGLPGDAGTSDATSGGAPPGSGAARHDADGDVGPDVDATSGGLHTDTGEDDSLAGLRRERDEYLDMVRRLQADFENYKKRVVRQQTDHLERAAVDVVTKMLPVLDAFDLARAHLGEGGDATEEGKALLAASGLLSDTLAREGLERIDEPGVAFDPTVHEAVEHVTAGEPADPLFAEAASETEDEERSEASVASTAAGHTGPIVDGVLRAGYRFKGRVIRPAMVRVRG
jgi:molecular chaperone GrpE